MRFKKKRRVDWRESISNYQEKTLINVKQPKRNNSVYRKWYQPTSGLGGNMRKSEKHSPREKTTTHATKV